MKKLLHTIAHFFSRINKTICDAYNTTKGGSRLVFTILFFFAIGGVLFFFQTILIQKSIVVPRYGGTLTEGMVGFPLSLDPLNATSESEQALSPVFFSALESLASSIDFNDTSTTAIVTLPANTRFHDGKPLTAEDVAFTYERARFSTNQTELFNQTYRDTTIQIQDPQKLVFTSTKEIPLSFFTLGIVPKHIWEKESISLKESLIGTGPFKAVHIRKKNDLTREIKTRRFSQFVGEKSHIRTIHFVFFENNNLLMEAISSGKVEGAFVDANSHPIPDKNFSIFPKKDAIALFALPAYDGLFTGERIPILEQLIDKNQILATVRNSYGSISGSHTLSSESFSEESQTLLQQKGVVFTKEGTVSQSPSTTLFLRDDPELIHTAQLLQNYYGILGLPIELKIFSRGVFQEEIKKNPSALILGYSTDSVLSSEKVLFPLFSLGVGRYKTYTLLEKDQPQFYQTQKRYEQIETWSLREELQWKRNKQEN